MSEAARVASRAHKKPSNGHCLSSVNSEQFNQSRRRSESRITLVEEIRKPKTASALTEEGRWAISIPTVPKIAIQILHKIKTAMPPKKIAPKNPNLRVRKRRRFTLIAGNGPIRMLRQ